MTAEQVEPVARCCSELAEENAHLRREVATLRARFEAANACFAEALYQVAALKAQMGERDA